MTEANEQLIAAVRESLARRADPAKAVTMRAYMKSEMPFLGVPGPQQEQVWREAFAAHPLGGFEEWRATVLRLWREARFREERYGAIVLTGDRRYRAFQTLEALPLYEELIITGAWWDLVDAVAQHRIGGLLRRYPTPMRQTVLAWSRSPDHWLRRTAILCQNRFGAATDRDLLYACIEPNLADLDFFIRKAIGWALREYATVDPVEVRRYVQEHASALSPLSRREALKHLADPAGS